jgi:hypothetical protein
VKKFNEYLQRAAECRDMARNAHARHKAQLENMAVTWELLAESRKKILMARGLTQDDNRAPREERQRASLRS